VIHEAPTHLPSSLKALIIARASEGIAEVFHDEKFLGEIGLGFDGAFGRFQRLSAIDDRRSQDTLLLWFSVEKAVEVSESQQNTTLLHF